MNYVSSSLTGIIALLGIIITIFYYTLEFPNLEISNMIKSPVGKGSFSKVIIGLAIISSIILISTYYFDLSKSNDLEQVIQMGPAAIISPIIAFIFLGIFTKLYYREKKILFSKEDVTAMFNQKLKNKIYECTQAFIYLINIVNIVVLIIIYCLYIYDENIQVRFISIMIIFFEVILMALASGFGLGFINLKSLKRYIIKTDEFEDGQVKALIITETDSELMIKCEKTYPIILSKSKISAYMCIDYLTDDQIENLIRDNTNRNDYNNTSVYEGYYVGVEEIKTNSKYFK